MAMLRSGWRRGGAIELGELAKLLTSEEKQLMKQQCGGLQTFLRNQHQVFKLTMSKIVENVLYLADSYKEGTTHVYSYFESRGGKFPEVCFFGLQYILKRWLVGKVVTHKMIDDAKTFYKLHFNMDVFNESGWRHIVDKHDGCLPLRIKAVPEGSVVPTKNVLFTIENTDPEVPWLTNWFETLLVQTWYPMTVCTTSRAYKQLIASFLYKTSDSMDGLPFKLHDFGYRGSTSVESAGLGGAAHLVNFVGTDTIAGLQLCREYYSCEMAGFSIPATEHSTITTWTREGEVAAFRNMLRQYPKKVIAAILVHIAGARITRGKVSSDGKWERLQNFTALFGEIMTSVYGHHLWNRIGRDPSVASFIKKEGGVRTMWCLALEVHFTND
ncbi:nicotinate phosphoribosyltransferase, (NAPRTase) family [Cooperia oncophora]